MRDNIKKAYCGNIFIYDLGESKGEHMYEGERPVVAISSMIGKQVMVCPLTSQIKKLDLASRVYLPNKSTDFLSEDSIIATEHIYTLPKNDNLKHKIGTLPHAFKTKVVNALSVSVGTKGAEYISLNGKCKRGQIVSYINTKGEKEYGLIIQNNIGNEKSTTTIVAKAVLSFGRIKPRNETKYNRFHISTKYINTISIDHICEIVDEVHPKVMNKITLNMMNMFRGKLV